MIYILCFVLVYNVLGLATVALLSWVDMDGAEIVIFLFWPMVWVAFFAGLITKFVVFVTETCKKQRK
jgi:hypothetical protein